MQAAATAVGFSAVLPVKGRPTARTTPVARVPAARRSLRVAAAAVLAAEPAEFDYSSIFSVFPMEACELLGGEACSAQMYPEVKLEAGVAAAASRRTEDVDRDYLAYDEPKTVFLSEACDDLGGEFCEAN
ncbi:hypothetical protein EJB05_32016 [Eragrostis curvula]|uniref:Light-regulated protein n=1 Tax=Eragrostis curvula TaxID=38414 RepID=A0A5J9UGN0_9POAL|nr:hypothetical protein EJB05_56529 [Eragrostis curvula]TVU22330.1 hypothetical protein EJB05_32016 [Eragrostis curvula]